MRDGFFVLHRDLPREGPGLPADVLWALAVAATLGTARICAAACGPAHVIAAARGRVRLGQRDMAVLPGVFDLIWCAGAMYFPGVTEGLRGWRGALAKAGRVAFSEPVLVREPVSDRVRAFWANAPCVTGLAGIRQRIAAASCRILGGPGGTRLPMRWS